jgi:uncharacterized protein
MQAHENRPWPPPARRWAMAMRWHDLLFAHWPVSEQALRPLVPAELQIDTFEGAAWVAVTPFAMTGVRPRYVPALPGLSRFLELNVRTYVTVGGKPGVWFFSLDAANLVAVQVARKLFHLPYFNAEMRQSTNGDWVHYQSMRTHQGEKSAAFFGRYRPTGEVFHTHPTHLEYWLTERYCLYARQGPKLLRAEIHHAPWPLQAATAMITRNTMLQAAGIEVDDPLKPSLLHFARRLDVVAWRALPVAV